MRSCPGSLQGLPKKPTEARSRVKGQDESAAEHGGGSRHSCNMQASSLGDAPVPSVPSRGPFTGAALLLAFSQVFLPINFLPV